MGFLLENRDQKRESFGINLYYIIIFARFQGLWRNLLPTSIHIPTGCVWKPGESPTARECAEAVDLLAQLSNIPFDKKQELLEEVDNGERLKKKTGYL